MTENYGKQLDKEIRQRSIKDLANRNFKSDQNRDRDIDMRFVHNQMILQNEIQDVKIGNKMLVPTSKPQVMEEQEDIPLDNRYIMSSQEQEYERHSEEEQNQINN